jgi:hypothetical protein
MRVLPDLFLIRRQRVRVRPSSRSRDGRFVALGCVEGMLWSA